MTGGDDGRVLVWDPAVPSSSPAELGRHNGWVTAAAELPDGQVVTAGEDGWVLVCIAAPAGAQPGWATTMAGAGDGGVARRAGGHKRERPAGAGMGSGGSWQAVRPIWAAAAIGRRR